MQARTYLPAYGKFAQVDPAYDQTKDDPESWNLYNYVTNNPITKTDPDGRKTANEMQEDFNRLFDKAFGDVLFGYGEETRGMGSVGLYSNGQEFTLTRSYFSVIVSSTPVEQKTPAAHTNAGDLPPVPSSITRPDVPAPGQGMTDNSMVETPGGGEKEKRLPKTNGKAIMVDLEAQKLTAYDKKKQVYEFDVVTGSKDHPTSEGTFKIYLKVTPYRSKKYDAPMNYAMFFDGGNAIHQFHGPFFLDRLGRSGGLDWGSHGCVRLSEGNARTLFEWAPNGTRVEVYR